MYTTTNFQFDLRVKLWRDVLSIIECKENVEKAHKVERNFAYELFKSVQCKCMNIEEDLQTHQGESTNLHDTQEISVNKYLLVFLDGQTIEMEQNVSVEMLYKPYELLNYPLDKDKEWLYNIKDLHCNHSVFSYLNDILEVLEICTRTQDIYKKALHYENKWLLVSTIDFLYSYISELVQAIHECNRDKFESLISSKAILVNELGEAYQISQDTAHKISSLDKYQFSTKNKNQTNLSTTYTEGNVHFKSLLNSMDTHIPFHEFTSYALSKASSKEQLSNPSMLLLLENVHLSENESLPSEIKESQISNKNHEVKNKQSIHLDNEWRDSMKCNINNNLIIQASRTIDTNDLEKYNDFNDLVTISTNSMDIISVNENEMNKSDRTHLISLEIKSYILSDGIFKGIATFKHLRCVSLFKNNLGPKECQYLSLSTSIRELDLSFNNIGPEGCQYLSQNTSIKELNLVNNNIGPEGCQYLRQNTTILKLILSNNNIGPEGCQYLSQNTSIKELNVFSNNIRTEGCQYLSQNTTIRELNVGSNFIVPEGCQYLSQNTTIRELYLGYNNIGSKGCQYLSQSKSIYKLDLTSNNIGPEGCQHLSQNTSIREISFYNNRIGPKGCQYLSQNTTLRELNLFCNDIRGKGAQYLSQSKSIRKLYLYANNIGDNGCQYLSQNTSLRVLELTNNDIGPEGCQYLSQIKTLKVLDLTYNNIGSEGCQYLSQNTSIRELNLVGNNIEPEGVQCLSHNTSLRKLTLKYNNLRREHLACFSHNVNIEL